MVQQVQKFRQENELQVLHEWVDYCAYLRQAMRQAQTEDCSRETCKEIYHNLLDQYVAQMKQMASLHTQLKETYTVLKQDEEDAEEVKKLPDAEIDKFKPFCNEYDEQRKAFKGLRKVHDDEEIDRRCQNHSASEEEGGGRGHRENEELVARNAKRPKVMSENTNTVNVIE